MAYQIDFEKQLINSRQMIFDDLMTKTDLKIPQSFWEYVDYLERCLWLNYKPPSFWKSASATNHGGLEQWRKHLSNNLLPFRGWDGGHKPN